MFYSVILIKNMRWVFFVEAVEDDGKPFVHVAHGVPQMREELPYTIQLPRDITFTNACKQISETVPRGQVWVLLAPGFVLMMGEKQERCVATMNPECVVCLGGFQRADDSADPLFGPAHAAEIMHFAWFGCDSSVLAKVDCDCRIRDSVSCCAFAYVLRRKLSLQLVNPVYSFLAMRVAESQCTREDESDSFCDFVAPQKYNSPEEQHTIRVVADNTSGIPSLSFTIETTPMKGFKMQQTMPEPFKPCKLYLPLGPEADRETQQRQRAEQLRKLSLLPIYTFSRTIPDQLRISQLPSILSAIDSPDHEEHSDTEPITQTSSIESRTIIAVESLRLSPRWDRRADVAIHGDIVSSTNLDHITSALQRAGVWIRSLSCPSGIQHRGIASRGFTASTCTKQQCNILSHSCAGEDTHIFNILYEHNRAYGGFYIDVGCGSEKHMNNTHSLYHQMGWRGISIDAQTHFVDEIRQKRPFDIAISAYVSDVDDAPKTFLVPHHPSEKRFASLVQFQWKCKYGSSPISLTSKTLQTIIRELSTSIDIPPISLLNITCEGEDYNILLGSDIKTLKPFIVCILYKNNHQFQLQSDLLSSTGYTLVQKMAWISIWKQS